MFKILVSDNIAAEGVEEFKKFKGIQVDVKTGLPVEELEKIIGDYDGLIVRSATKFKGALVEKALKMKVVGRAGAGFDNIDVESCSKRGIIVMNTPGGNSNAVAELTLGYIFSLSRNYYKATSTMKDGKWEKKIFEKSNVEIAGKTLGLLGVGNIGSIVAVKASALNMNVLVFDPFLTEEKASIIGVKKVDKVDELYKNSDYISLHLPLNPDTKNYINKDSFSKMKKGVYIINCARGGIINEKDLLEAVNSGIVQQAALDVFEKEPVDPKDPLINNPNIICSPHIGAASVEAQIVVSIAIAKQVCDYLLTGEIVNAVNVPSLDAKTRERIKPYVDLAKKMGTLYHQYSNLNISNIEMEFTGEVCSMAVNAVTTSLLIGLFEGSIEDINFVNAKLIAKEKGIKVSELKKEESSDYVSQIILNADHKEGKTVIKGAVFKNGMIRIVEIDGFPLDFNPEGNLLLTLNNDIPGFIGEIGTAIGKANLNISNMELGRNTQTKKALSFIQIDGEIPDKVIDDIKKIKALEKVYKIKLN